jgi:hypothetical protein
MRGNPYDRAYVSGDCRVAIAPRNDKSRRAVVPEDPFVGSVRESLLTARVRIYRRHSGRCPKRVACGPEGTGVFRE